MGKTNKPKSRKGGPVTATRKKEIVTQLSELILNGQMGGVPINVLQKKFDDVSRQTLSKYLDEAYKTIPKDDVEKVYQDFTKLFDRMFRICYEMLNNTNNANERLRVLAEIRNLIKDKVDLLERFFVKAKAPENIHIEGEIDNKFTLEIIDNSNVIDVEDSDATLPNN